MRKAGVYLLYAMLVAAMLTLATPTLSAQPTPGTVNQTTITANGVGVTVFWTDFSNAADIVGGYVEVVPIGGKAAAEPGYLLYYGTSDQLGQINDAGSGPIPGSAVSTSGSIANGNAIITVNVNTCDLSAFQTTNGTCGTVDITSTETPGFSYSTKGTSTLTFGTHGTGTTRIATTGTTENGNAVSAGNVIGVPISSTDQELVFISVFTGVQMTITRP